MIPEDFKVVALPLAYTTTLIVPIVFFQWQIQGVCGFVQSFNISSAKTVDTKDESNHS